MSFIHKKTFFATLVLLSLMACSSGGGGSSEPTTSVNNTNDTITVPNVSHQGNSETSVHTLHPMNPTTAQATTFNIDKDGYATGKATYSSAKSSIVLNADFDNKSISGYAKEIIEFEDSPIIEIAKITLHNTTLYKSTEKYTPYGKYISYRNTYDFLGNASAVTDKGTKFTGKYGGTIWGDNKPFDRVEVGYHMRTESYPDKIIYDGTYSNGGGYYKRGKSLYRQ